MTLFSKVAGRSPELLRILANFWPPFLGAGIHVVSLSSDFSQLRVRLRRGPLNSNYVGTQFGGSIYAMTDPFYMLMLLNRLGNSYIVWDKAASIDFKKPGKTELFADFRISDEVIEQIKKQTDTGGKYIFDLSVDVCDANHVVVATIVKTLYVRKKKKIPS